MVPFFHNLRTWRISRGLTQGELAVRSGVPRPNLVALERGKRECNLSTLYRLAHALEISPGVLIDQSAPGHQDTTLGRHEIDAIARNLLTGKGVLSPSLTRMRDQAAFEAGPLLRVAGAPRVPKSRPRSWIPSRQVAQILERVRRLAASLVSGGADEERRY